MMKFKAFTIVELIVVITVIAILAGVTVVGYGAWRQSMAKNEAQSDLRQLAAAMDSAKNFSNGYPTSLPSNFTGSENLTITYGSGDSKRFCIQARSKADTSIVYNIVNGKSDPATGTCTVPCNTGDSLNGSTCTNSYTATYQGNTYTCPSGGSLSGTTCTRTYSAHYQNSYYSCPNGDTLSGAQCSYSASSTRTCPSGGYDNGGSCMVYHGSGSTTSECQSRYGGATSYWGSGFGSNPPGCYSYYSATYTYNCHRGGSLSSGRCYYAATHHPGGNYYCDSGDTLSGTTCTDTYTATNTGAGYSCPNGGTLNGTNCTSTYAARS